MHAIRQTAKSTPVGPNGLNIATTCIIIMYSNYVLLLWSHNAISQRHPVSDTPSIKLHQSS